MPTKRTNKGYRSEIAAAVHEMVEGFHDAGLIDKQTMREFDASSISVAEALPPEEIRALREREQDRSPFLHDTSTSRGILSLTGSAA
jgi:putative transcriptional regulator